MNTVKTETADTARRIVQWQETLTRLPDEYFFDLVRMYLGEIKTPYNKQKLIEKLGAFLRRPENRKNMEDMLDRDDCTVITAVAVLPEPTQEKLLALLGNGLPFNSVYERILNLEERLILYRTAQDGKTVFAVNPLTEDIVLPHSDIRLLLPETPFPSAAAQNVSGGVFSPLILAALLPFFSFTPDFVKTDGTLKKRTQADIQRIFQGIFPDGETLLHFISALRNLSLIHVRGSGLAPDRARWDAFASLPPLSQYAYITAASCGRFTRNLLHKTAQTVLDILESFPPAGENAGYTRDVLYRSSFICTEKRMKEPVSGQSAKQGRFAALLRSAENTQDGVPAESGQEENRFRGTASEIPKALADAAIRFGLITGNGGVFRPSPAVIRAVLSDAGTSERPAGTDEKKEGMSSVSVDAGFTVTVFPGLPLARLLPLTAFTETESLRTAAVFTLTRRACLKSFDSGYTPEKIISLLETYSGRTLPQNVSFSVREWYKNYTSASLFRGYVLKTDTEKQVLVENSEALRPYVTCMLAPGIYLFDFEDDDEASELFARAGLDFVGTVKKDTQSSPPLPLPRLSAAVPFSRPSGAVPDTADGSPEVVSGMYAALDKLYLSPEQDEALRSRINRKIVLNSVQLRPESVRFEKIEAGGMDFLGKVHVAEHALASGSMIELRYEENNADGEKAVTGVPVSVEKRENDTFVKIISPGTGTERSVSLGRASHIRRIRGPLLRDRHRPR